MKLFFSEYQPDYSKYYFPYQVYLVKDESDNLDDIYNMGFLPSRAKLNLFYLARSIRVNLQNFEQSSENRRVMRKVEYLKLEIKSLEEFEYNYKIGKLGSDFYKQRFGKGVMSAFRIKWLFTQGACSHVLVYYDKRKDNKIIGYCLVTKTDKLIHYAYPFYDVEYIKENAGMGMMLKAICRAKDSKSDYIYLGTCYTESSLYKTQFSGVEYFNGFGWSEDIKELKNLVRVAKKGHMFEGVKDKENLFRNKGMGNLKCRV